MAPTDRGRCCAGREIGCLRFRWPSLAPRALALAPLQKRLGQRLLLPQVEGRGAAS